MGCVSRGILLRAKQVARRGQSISHLVDQKRFAQNRVCSRLQGLRNADVIAYDCQRERPFGGLAFAGCGQQQGGFGLLIPIDDDDLKILMGGFFDRGYRVGAVLSLDTETSQHLKNRRSCSLVRGKQKAAKGHASTD